MRCHPPGKAAEYLANGWWSGDTFDGLLRARVAADPDRLAVVDPPNTGELIGADPVRWTWAELGRHVDDAASGLLASGVRAGDVVAVQLPNCSALVCALLAIVRIGAISTPFPMSYREHEIGGMCARTGAVTMIVTESNAERAPGLGP